MESLLLYEIFIPMKSKQIALQLLFFLFAINYSTYSQKKTTKSEEIKEPHYQKKKF